MQFVASNCFFNDKRISFVIHQVTYTIGASVLDSYSFIFALCENLCEWSGKFAYGFIDQFQERDVDSNQTGSGCGEIIQQFLGQNRNVNTTAKDWDEKDLSEGQRQERGQNVRIEILRWQF